MDKLSAVQQLAAVDALLRRLYPDSRRQGARIRFLERKKAQLQARLAGGSVK